MKTLKTDYNHPFSLALKLNKRTNKNSSRNRTERNLIMTYKISEININKGKYELNKQIQKEIKRYRKFMSSAKAAFMNNKDSFLRRDCREDLIISSDEFLNSVSLQYGQFKNL